jgi:nucleotide-binding universal stress UspA family protein
MYKKVLVAYDGSRGSRGALERACGLAQMYGAQLTLVWVRSPLPHHALALAQADAENDAADEFFEGLKQEAAAVGSRKGITMDSTALYGDPAREIVHFAEHRGFDLIVCGQTGHSDIISRMLGQTADRISETAKCDVLIVAGS